MQNKITRFIALSFLVAFSATAAFSQITIKIPRIGKPRETRSAQTQPSPQPAQSSPASAATDNPAGGEFRVGDAVEIYCDCFGRMEWTPGKIESVHGNYYTVRYGSGRYQTKFITFDNASSIRDPKKAGQEAKTNQSRGAFLEDARQFYPSVRYLMAVYNPDLRDSNSVYMPPTDPAEWTKIRQDLETLDKLCTKYGGVSNPRDTFNDISRMPAAWCEIAAKRVEYEKRGKGFALSREFRQMSETFVIGEIDEAMKDSWGYVPDKLQKMLFEREAWKRERTAEWQAKYAAVGAEMPADLFSAVDKKIDELKAYVDRTAPNRKWEQPGNRDATAETLVKGKIAAEYKGAQILKIGSSYNGWRMHKNSLGIPTNQYKRGWVLLKVPNRPFCESREWLLLQEYAGGGRWSATRYKGLGAAILMSCNQ